MGCSVRSQTPAAPYEFLDRSQVELKGLNAARNEAMAWNRSPFFESNSTVRAGEMRCTFKCFPSAACAQHHVPAHLAQRLIN